MRYENEYDRLPIMEGADDFRPLEDTNLVRRTLNIHNKALGEYQNRIDALERGILYLWVAIVIFMAALLGCLILLTILR
jgi:hypothetical protein